MLLNLQWEKKLKAARPTAGFRSAKELGITVKQRNALIKTLSYSDGCP